MSMQPGQWPQSGPGSHDPTGPSTQDYPPPWPTPPTPTPPTPPTAGGLGGFRITDIILTVLMSLALVGVSLIALLMILLAPMATDQCYPDCGASVDVAWSAMWISLPVGFVVAVGGTILAAIKRWAMFIWPLLGCVIMGATAWIGIEFIESAAGM